MLLSCDTNNENIITLLGSKQSFRQVTNVIYYNKNGFCSTSLVLNNDSTFLNETGCEGRSHITIGTWKVVNDSVELNAMDRSKLRLIANIELSKERKCLQTTFLIIDKTGTPVSDFVILPISNNKKIHFTSNPSIVVDDNDAHIYCPKTNANGVISIEKSKFDTLVFPQLEFIAKKEFRIPSKWLPDTIKIYLDIIDYGFAFSELTYRYWNSPVKLRMDKDKLVNFDNELKRIK